MKRGFTLIELLVVIAILGILVIGLVAAINPGDKINSASDARVLNDIGVFARASESYILTYGTYPSTLNALVTSRDLKSLPTAPSGYAAYALTVASPNIYITGQLKSTKYASTPRALYSSSNGKQCQVSAAITVCP